MFTFSIQHIHQISESLRYWRRKDGIKRATSLPGGKRKGKEEYLYSAFFGQGGTLKALRHGSHSFTCK